MDPARDRLSNLSPEVLVLIFKQLTDNPESLCNVGLTCRAWRYLSLPCLLETVDLSSHNNGRLPEHETFVRPLVYADYSAAFRPRNLVPRQRAFLRLITSKPDLAKYVQSLAWTLIWLDVWRDSEQGEMTDIDRQTWNVFSQLKNVTRLDLASLHEIHHEAIVRHNPTRLFPAVTHLRLAGWMHRGLVKAVVTSLEPSKLRSLALDCLQDEGALSNNTPMPIDIALEYAQSARRTNRSDTINIIDDGLFQRQEKGKASIFPGPMWLPLRLFSTCSLSSLTHLEVKVASFDMDIDLRNYHTIFHETAELIAKAKESLKSLVVIFEEPDVLCARPRRGECGTWRNQIRGNYRPWCIKMAAAFLNQLLAVLCTDAFPHLEDIRFEGFHLLETASPDEAAAAQLAATFHAIRECAFTGGSFTEVSNIGDRQAFLGFNCIPNLEGVNDLRGV